MKSTTLKRRLESHLNSMRKLAHENLTHERNTLSESQFVCVNNALIAVEMAINGISDEDMKVTINWS